MDFLRDPNPKVRALALHHLLPHRNLLLIGLHDLKALCKDQLVRLFIASLPSSLATRTSHTMPSAHSSISQTPPPPSLPSQTLHFSPFLSLISSSVSLLLLLPLSQPSSEPRCHPRRSRRHAPLKPHRLSTCLHHHPHSPAHRCLCQQQRPSRRLILSILPPTHSLLLRPTTHRPRPPLAHQCLCPGGHWQGSSPLFSPCICQSIHRASSFSSQNLLFIIPIGSQWQNLPSLSSTHRRLQSFTKHCLSP